MAGAQCVVKMKCIVGNVCMADRAEDWEGARGWGLSFIRSHYWTVCALDIAPPSPETPIGISLKLNGLSVIQ
ncbi:hypothetical protein XELAEV_18040580mg [Xenopus laevis]|uniref:Uncharacterized protein n=1 Tax=Xenopus laevis TaxID=8355 RepID=A0A974C9W2_XENLA|nr:hypothetical protein XELAEV_18040580mg [Xenopus laevis]